MQYDLTKLTCQNIVDLLEEAGYNESSSDIFSTEYVSCTNGQVKYKMKFYDLDSDDLLEDYVYVFINSQGKLTADY